MKMKTFYQCFAQQVRENPDRTALTYKEKGMSQGLTYRELSRQVNNLADYLMEQYATCPRPINIGVLLNGSVHWVVSVLAIWKVGFTYVPIGTDAQDVRIRSIAKHCHLRAILTHRAFYHKKHLFSELDIPAHELESLKFKHESLEFDCQESHIEETTIAYILHTSGTTGTPKGVAIGHAGLPHCFESMNRILNVTKDDVVALFAWPSFDASLCELMMALGAGACLFLVPEDERLDKQQLPQSYCDNNVTVALLTPSFLKDPAIQPEHFALTAAASEATSSIDDKTASTSCGPTKKLTRIISIGEALTHEVLKKWSPFCAIFNGYGPTEATIATSTGIVSRKDTPFHEDTAIHAGRIRVVAGEKNDLIEGLHVWILKTDPNNKQKLIEVPDGEEGEIYISGTGLAFGYYGDSPFVKEMDHKAFLTIDDPHDASKKLRVYRTFDRGLIDTEGFLQIKGRLGRQCKLAGKVVQLSDIENEICELLGNTLIEIHVTLEHEKLVAYLRLQQPSDITADASSTSSSSSSKANLFSCLQSDDDWSDFFYLLREHSKSYYTVPSVWHVVNEPLYTQKQDSSKSIVTDLSKITRVKTRYIHDRKIRELKHEEIEMATVWREILALPSTEPIYAHDDFLSLGGDSFKLTQLVSQLSTEYNLSKHAYQALLKNLLARTRLVDMTHSLKYARNLDVPLERKSNTIEIDELVVSVKKTRPPLFVIHALMGNAIADYTHLKNAWENINKREQALYGVSAHSCQRNNNEPDATPANMDIIVEDYMHAIINKHDAEYAPDAPYFIAGWSAGGVIALAIGDKLTQLGKVVFVQVIDSSSPLLMQNTSNESFLELLRGIFHNHICPRYNVAAEAITHFGSSRFSQLPKHCQVEQLFAFVIDSNKEKRQLCNELDAAKNLILASIYMKEPMILAPSVLYIVPNTQAMHPDQAQLGWQSTSLEAYDLPNTLTHMSVLTENEPTQAMAKRLFYKCLAMCDPLEKKLFAMHDLSSIDNYFADEQRYYIPAQGYFPRDPSQSIDAATEVNKFLNADKLSPKVLLVSGCSGSGKSMLCWQLIRYYTQQYTPEEPIFLYISLPTVPNINGRLLEDRLLSEGFNETEIEKLKKERQFIIILDSYDEIPMTADATRGSLITSNNLHLLNAKIIVTCQSEYLDKHTGYSSLFSDNVHGSDKNLQEMRLSPFSKSKIEEYIKNRISHDLLLQDKIITGQLDEAWLRVETYTDWFKKLVGLESLVSNPFLLKIACETLPNTAKNHALDIENKKKERMVALHLHRDLAAQWFLRQIEKLTAHKKRPTYDIIHYYIEFAQELATYMKEHNITQVAYYERDEARSALGFSPRSPMTEEQKNCANKFFNKNNPYLTSARQGCPLFFLRQNGWVYVKFIHEEIGSYFASESLLDHSLHAETQRLIESATQAKIQNLRPEHKRSFSPPYDRVTQQEPIPSSIDTVSGKGFFAPTASSSVNTSEPLRPICSSN